MNEVRELTAISSPDYKLLGDEWIVAMLEFQADAIKLDYPFTANALRHEDPEELDLAGIDALWDFYSGGGAR